MADLYGLEASGLPPELVAQLAGTQGRRKIAESMLQRGLAPQQVQQGTMSLTQGLAQLLNAYAGRKGMDQADQEAQSIAEKRKSMVSEALANYEKQRMGQAMQTAPFQADTFPGEAPIEGLKTVTQQAIPADRRGAARSALASPFRELRNAASTDLKFDEMEEARTARTDAAKAEQARKLQEAAMRSEDKQAQIQAQKDIAEQNRIARAEAEKRADETRRFMAQLSADTKREMAAMRDSKPTKLPPAVLKMQMEAADAISTASGINERLDKAAANIETGKMDLGLIGRSEAFLRNNLNMSNEKTRNLASFQADLEKLRNDSLRLNKGVQTEGDAQRAWNELVANINDAGVVKQRLAEIKGINDRAIEMRKREIDVIRANSGLEPLDLTPFEGKSKMGADGAPMPKTGPFADPAKEARYQEWLKRQGR